MKKKKIFFSYHNPVGISPGSIPQLFYHLPTAGCLQQDLCNQPLSASLQSTLSFFFCSNRIIKRTLDLKCGGNYSLKKKKNPLFFSWLQVPLKESGAGFAGNFQMSPNSVLQKFCCTSSAGKGKAQTADKVTLTTGNMLDMLSSTGLEEADNKGLTHLKCRSKLSQGFSLWRYLTAAITFLFHVSTDFNSRSCNSSCNLFSSQ